MKLTKSQLKKLILKENKFHAREGGGSATERGVYGDYRYADEELYGNDSPTRQGPTTAEERPPEIDPSYPPEFLVGQELKTARRIKGVRHDQDVKEYLEQGERV